MERELRFNPAASLRMEGGTDGQPLKVVGYAAVFNSMSELLPEGYREIIRRHAFQPILATNPDVRFLLNHEGLPLARTTSGTLKLAEDERGLRFEATLSDPTEDRDVASIIPKMKRGDLDNCSFAFNVANGDYSFRQEGDEYVRDIAKMSGLFDVSLVTYPAYRAASASLRGQFEGWKQEQETSQHHNSEKLKLRMRMLGLTLRSR